MLTTNNPLCAAELILFAIIVVLLLINPGVRGRER